MNANHPSDRDLLLALDGELSVLHAARIRHHLSACPSCRARQAELQQAGADVAHLHHSQFAPSVPPAEGPRALLRARLAEAESSSPPQPWHFRPQGAVAAVLLVSAAFFLYLPPRRAPYTPVAAWTPGAIRPAGRDQVCAAPGRAESAPAIPAAVAQQIFNRYGIRDPRPRSYEVDYLIPPSLGGSSDPRNLWPQPYAAGVWNARVKDALEDHLRGLVCSGQLDLATAQRDLARDWIAAYKKYFRTTQPLLDHIAFVKDRPWE
jgi:hypothetical protein